MREAPTGTLKLRPREYASKSFSLPTDDLATTRFGLRFVNARTEKVYRSWQARSVVPLVRVGMVASALAWAGALLAVLFAAPDKIGDAMLVVGATTFPVLGAVFALTLSEKHAHWVPYGAMFANTSSGLTVGALAFWLVDVPVLGSIGTIAVAFFGFTVFRLRTLHAVLASVPYIAATLALFFRAGPGLDRAGWVISWVGVLVLWAVCIFIGFLNEGLNRRAFTHERTIDTQQLQLEGERRRADELLKSILPEAIAERLKRTPGVIAQQFDPVTVLFADLVGFTPLAARLPAEEVVGVLDAIFTRFDLLAEQHGVEKVKTIGDAYMAVAGAPQPLDDDAGTMARLALAICREMASLRQQTGHALSVRIGLCSGPVIAGVIGAQKFAWDIWGDTVNTAARMESHGLVDKIQISESTFTRLEGRFVLEDRGTLEVKGKGPMRTWLLTGEHGGSA